MDIHDTPSVSRNIPIEPGMVITIEPGECSVEYYMDTYNFSKQKSFLLLKEYM